MDPIARLLGELMEALDLFTTPAVSITYDIPSGTLTVSDVSGVTIASGTTVEAVYAELHP